MSSAYNLTQARKKLPALMKECLERPVPLTRKKQVIGFLLSRERMESMLETIEVMQDRKAMKALRDYETGKTTFHPLSALG